MRITMYMPGLSPHSLGWPGHADFAAAMTELGHSFRIATTAAIQPAHAAGDAVLRVAVPPWSTVIGRSAAPLLRVHSLVPSAVALARHLRRHGSSIDLLHAEVAYPVATAVVMAIRMSGWPGRLAVTPMGEDLLTVPDASYGFRRHAVPRLLIGWTLRRTSCIRSISPLVDDQLARLGLTRPRRVVPLNITWQVARTADLDTDALAERRRHARRAVDERFSLHGQPIVLAFGRVHPFKGVDVLVRALPLLPDARLLIVGPSLQVLPFGDSATRLRQLARSLGIDDRVRFVERVPPAEALETLAAADVVAVPSHLESFNKVCVEAASVGTPYVVTSTTGISAWTPESGAGQVVPPRDPAAMAAAIQDVFDGRWQYDRDRASTFVRQFRPDTVAAQVAEFYRSVVGVAE